MLLNLLFLLLLQINYHFVHHFFYLGEAIQLNPNSKRCQAPSTILATMTPGHCQKARSCVCTLLLHQLPHAGQLHKAHCLAKQVACIIIRQDGNGLRNGNNLIHPRLLAFLVVCISVCTTVLHFYQELLVCSECLRGVLQRHFCLRHALLSVRQLHRLLFHCSTCSLHLTLLGSPQALEAKFGLHLRSLQLGQVFFKRLLHLLQHSEY
mmetsp:Transcript_45499/g.90122  ORF Transcript_45499/g.90122 Transcript_45499/m.90122 type:complete len:208 (-) Transcript_45499:787-1410(-)